MDDEIELIRDNDGLAVIGEPAAVERFLSSQGLPSKELDLTRVTSALSNGAAALKVGSEIAASSGRWVKLTKESAKALNRFPPMKGSQPGLSRAVLMSNGKTKHILEFARGGGMMALNPAMLAGAAGIMSQMAMQQQMDDIADYLAVIDAKVDEVLRAQKDAAVAGMIGAELEIDEAMTLRHEVGWVSDITWSKVQSSSSALKSTQAYALRQLDAIVEKVERQHGVGDMAETIAAVEPTVQEWLAVLARCFQLQDAMAVLELDRVLTSSPEELDRHRRGLTIARQKRLDVIAGSTGRLMERVDAAAGSANAKVLFHPFKPREVVQTSNRVATGIGDFHEVLGIEADRESLSAKRWRDAAGDLKDDAIENGADGIELVGRFGGSVLKRARTITADMADQVAERARGDRSSQPKEVDVPSDDLEGSPEN
ncbi:hypothetical protein [Frondihabitans peucedani]|uniref:Uncharacterized protein n=1 Tax=Frondihabitans peucedani TaxID=598626 RepID=A0ABP8DXL3_9MICO